MVNIFNRRKRFRNTPESFLTHSSGASGDNFGNSVSLSGDGNTLAVGTAADNVGANTDQGSCTIFTRSGNTWTQQAFLTYSSGATNDQFGTSVSLNSDGNTLAVGASNDQVGANNSQGSCTIFTRSGSTWTEQAYLTYSSGAAFDSFGISVSLSGDGNTLAVGAYLDNIGANADQGSCTIFTRSGSTWSQQAYLTYSGGDANDQFGYSVSLSDNGDTLAVGARYDYVGSNGYQGSCTIFTRSGTTWSQQAYLTYSSGQASDQFGFSVSLSADGNTLAVGANGDNAPFKGSCVIFTRSGSTWSEQAYLTYSGAIANDNLGYSVSLNNDGNILVVGAPQAGAPGWTDVGFCVIFTRTGSTWTEQTHLTYSGVTGEDWFGRSVSISNNGNTLAVGAPIDDIGAIPNQGSCVVYYRR